MSSGNIGAKNELIELFMIEMIEEIINSDNTDEDEEYWDDFLLKIQALSDFRYCVPFVLHSIPKSNFFQEVLFNLDDFRFKRICRVTRQAFEMLLHLIQHDPVFYGRNSEKQLSIPHQLIITLYMLGNYGGNVTKSGTYFGIGDGGTIKKILKRVFSCFLRLSDQYIFWPSEIEREQIVEQTMDEIPGSIGYVDGSEIILFNKPATDHESFYSRKSNYSLKIQVVGDHNKKIRHVVLGYPGSVHDARIYANCDLALHPERYFGHGQFIIGDKAYSLSRTVITPFKANNRTHPPAVLSAFNYHLSKYRIRIEHLFGILTERFPSLKELRVLIFDVQSLQFAFQWIYCCCILHNILIDYGFEALHIFDDFVEEEELNPNGPMDLHLNENARAGAQIREELLRHILFNL